MGAIRTVLVRRGSQKFYGELVCDRTILPAIAHRGRSANGNLKESDASFQQIDTDSEMSISISSDEDHTLLSENNAKKQRKVSVSNSVFSTGQPPGVTRPARKWMFRKSKVAVNLALVV